MLIVCGGGWRGVGLCPLSGLYVAGSRGRGWRIGCLLPLCGLGGQGVAGRCADRYGVRGSLVRGLVCSVLSLLSSFVLVWGEEVALIGVITYKK